MKTCLYKIAVLLLFQASVYGQSPDWVVNESQFQYTMSFVAFLNVNGNTMTSTNDKVGAFVNGELRGAANLIYIANADRYLAYLVVLSNTTNETVEFKIYDSVNNQVVDVDRTVTYEIDEHYGNVFQAFSLANPTLSIEANIIDFSFDGAGVTNSTILNNQITIESNAFIDQNINALNAIFELSPGAKLYDGTDNLLSGNNSLDFTIPNTLHVLSADESVFEEWNIEVKSTPLSNKDFELLTGILLYPNPIKVDNLNLKIPNCNEGDLSYQLFSIHGQQLMSQELNTELTIIPMYGLSEGMYLLKVNLKNKALKTFKIINWH